MKEEKTPDKAAEEKPAEEDTEKKPLSKTWAQDALGDLEDWIEEQGVYIRQ